ncbi:MAG: hypothetical protein QGH20_08005 [Candidatus Latescibacteria bacterium]|jgi:hypothetical protein|nr:hypothetical protein [Candidatus Latescibacterota bacterium]
MIKSLLIVAGVYLIVTKIRSVLSDRVKTRSQQNEQPPIDRTDIEDAEFTEKS